MIFSSLEFLFFLLVFGSVFFFVRHEVFRKWWILFASYLFYSFWNWKYLPLLILTTVVAYYAGILIERAHSRKLKKWIFVGSLVYALGILLFFKYSNFILTGGSRLGLWPPWTSLHLVAPLGISFFSFQFISYVSDVYQKRVQACRRPLDFFVYKAFFPQLIAGPIVRATQFLPQMDQWRPLRSDIVVGCRLFLYGFFQKAVLADSLSHLVDTVFGNLSLYSSQTLLLSVFAYAAQIFYDFSGYSLMAIGLARSMGFRFPENFAYPYLATTIQDFWRRWHISLSSWLRDYLYIPLGGSRGSRRRVLLNIMVTMILGGLWHGAGLNFILWGFLHGLFLVFHRVCIETPGFRCPSVISWFVTQTFVVIAWIFFRSPDLSTALMVLGKISWAWSSDGIHWWHSGTLLALTAMIFHHVWILWQRRRGLAAAPEESSLTAAQMVFEFSFWILMIVLFSPAGVKPFIYFQF